MWIFESGMFDHVRTKDKLIGIGILMGPLIALLAAGAIFLAPEPFDRKLLWGCYTADRAPSLEITQANIRVFQNEVPPFVYTAEPSKTGYRMVVQTPFELAKGNNGIYDFRQAFGVPSYDWTLLAIKKGDLKREFRQPREFSGLIQVASRDYETIIYARDATGSHCQSKGAI